MSDTKALREYFYKGVCYTLNDASGIYKAILELITNLDKLKLEMKDLKIELSLKSKKMITQFKEKCLEINE